jgi:putative selenium metabolism hydrolase
MLPIDEAGVIDFAKRLIAIPSPSGQERQCAQAVAREMEKVGFKSVRLDERSNVLGRIGQGEGDALLFLAHTDHAGVGSMDDPFSARETDGALFCQPGKVIWGRGACDMKGALAAMVYAGEALFRAASPELPRGIAPRREIILLAFTLEEMGRTEGLRYALANHDLGRVSMAVSGEATSLRVHRGHRGSMEFLITVHGRTSHSSNPDRGVNAIFQMNRFLSALRNGYRMPQHEFLGPATFTVIDIAASPGRATPIVPDRCEIVLDRRTLPGETPETVEVELRALAATLSEEDPSFRMDIKCIKVCRGMLTPEDAPVVRALQWARDEVMGQHEAPSTWKFGIDVFDLEDMGISVAGFGPGDEIYAHTPQEHVPVEDILTATRVYAQMMQGTAGT